MSLKSEEIRQLLIMEKIEEAEKIISDLIEENDSKNLSDLIVLLDDKYKYDEVMFSIVHAMETLQDDSYVRNYLDHIEDLYNSSPRWASILLIRIVNNKSTFAILKDLLEDELRARSIINKVRNRALNIKKDIPEL